MTPRQFRTFPASVSVNSTPEPCPLRTALGAIGGRWKPLVLFYLLKQPRSFGELSRELGSVSNKTLATQLRELERDGLISRKVCDDARRSVRYPATESGAALNPVLRALIEWGNWRIANAGASEACG